MPHLYWYEFTRGCEARCITYHVFFPRRIYPSVCTFLQCVCREQISVQIHFFVHVRRVEFQSIYARRQKISRLGEGQYFVVFSRDTSKWSLHEVKTTKWSKKTGNKFEKQKRWRPNFLEVFFALSTPHGFRLNSKKNKKPIFYRNPWFKILRWF